MIQLSSFMWLLAMFCAFIGFLRGWQREVVVTAGMLVVLFALLQFDPYLRGLLLFTLPRDQIFLIQAALFIAATLFLYQARDLGRERARGDVEGGLLGALVGFINGYLIGGTLWYFMDINEYPLPQLIVAPSLNSPSAQSITIMPLVLLGGGASGTGDFLTIITLGVFLFVIIRTQ